MQFRAKAKRNALYERDHQSDDEDEDDLQSHSSRKLKQGKGMDKDGSRASKKSRDGSHKKPPQKEKKKKGSKRSRDASSDEEEEVSGPQLSNIMQIMEQQQR